MKFFVCCFALTTLACIASADKADKKEGIVGAPYGPPSYAASSYAPAPSYGPGLSYGPAPSYGPALSLGPAPALSSIPCPKNYLVSCQPSLAPVACGAGSGGSASISSGGYAGAYSEHIPHYAIPQYAYSQY